MNSNYIINLANKNVIKKIENSLYTIEFWTANKIGIKKNYNIILLEKKDKNYFFSSYGQIINIESVNLINEIGKQDKKQWKHLIELSLQKNLVENNNLNDISYSLFKICKYFKKPYKHFNHPYSSISYEDYNTIIEGKIFISRTAFGKLFNSLHNEHQLNFMNIYFKNYPYNFFSAIDYIKIFELLKKYIDFHILQPAKMLKISHNILQHFMEKNIVNELNFSEDSSENSNVKYDNISKQVEKIDSLLAYDPKENFLNEISEIILQENQNEKRFNDIFRKMLLPINLKRE